MPRKKRESSPTGIYHWIVRGMNRKKLFYVHEDFQKFRELLLEYKALHKIEIYHYCFMSNHVHLLIWAKKIDHVSSFSHFVQRRYAYYYCEKYKRTGSAFQRRYRSIPIDREEYLLECGRYIERNPIKAKIVKRAEEYPYSSFKYYAFGEEDNLISESPAFEALSENIKQRREIYDDYVHKLRIQEEMFARGLLTA